jgi:amino acid transporter
VAVTVFGTLTTDEVIAARENALAEAARPVFGSVGFALVSVTALIATASAINASLYALTNVTYQMAKEGELPGKFGEPIAHSREGLLVSAVLIALLAVAFDLGRIALLGALSVLVVHAVVHVGHLRLVDQTGANRLAVVAAAVLSVAAVVLSLREADAVIWLLFTGLLAVAFVTEVLIGAVRPRVLRTRTPPRTPNR